MTTTTIQRLGAQTILLAACLLGMACLVGLGPTAQAQVPMLGKAYPGVLQVRVDATQAAQRLLQVQMRLPVRPGLLRLQHPRWLPGHHGPAGDITRIASFSVAADGRSVPWQRHPIDVQRLEVDVPPGVTELALSWQWLGALDGAQGNELTGEAMLSLLWTGLLLYPVGYDLRGIQVAAELQLPVGWSWAGSLREQAAAAPGTPGTPATPGPVRFMPETLETLFDSPLFLGAHLRRVALDAAGHPQPATLHILSDSATAKGPSEEQLQAHRRLFEQADKLFGHRPWRQYALLLANARGQPHIALEHQASSENAYAGDYWDDWAAASRGRDDVAHELVHAWNGKLHRPADLWAPDLNTPTGNTLLWVYEGLTQYWGFVLAARSGLVTNAQVQQFFANSAAYYGNLPARAWRPLQDTTHAPNINPSTSPRFRELSRARFDYYSESALLIWLDADTLIREASGGARSLDDLAEQFFGAGQAVRHSEAGPRLYRFDDLVAALNRVQPHDWRGFLRQRLDRLDAQVPLEGLERSGWRLQFASRRTPLMLAELNRQRPMLFLTYSLGLSLSREGNIGAVRWQSPAFNAGLMQGEQVVAVGMQAYSEERIEAALNANREGGQPLGLLVKRGEQYRLVSVDVRGGARYATLVRNEAAPDLLSRILAPR